MDKTSGGTVTQTRTYYPAGGAMRIGSTLYYTLKDHLGSASVVTDASGNTVGEDRFYPFGETRFTTGTMYTDKLFTGQRNTGLGIYHYGARFYSPKLGRFLSADTIVPGYANPQNLNRYSYVTNNPLRYTDPTGHWSDEGCGTGGSGCNIPPPSTNVLVGVSPGNGPFNPSLPAEDGTCAGCSIEPELPNGPSGSPELVGVLGDSLTGLHSSWALNAQDIPVYVTTITNSNGSMSATSLTVDNTNMNVYISVVQVSFNVSGDNTPCFTGICLSSAPYGYGVQPQLGYYSSDILAPGIGAITSPHSTQTISLIPSGYPNNPTNTFDHDFTITVVLGDGQTGNTFLPISVTIQP